LDLPTFKDLMPELQLGLEQKWIAEKFFTSSHNLADTRIPPVFKLLGQDYHRTEANSLRSNATSVP